MIMQGIELTLLFKKKYSDSISLIVLLISTRAL